MDEKRAREILVSDVIQKDNSLYSGGWYLAWPSCGNVSRACLDGDFTADELEAIAWWMRNVEVKHDD